MKTKNMLPMLFKIFMLVNIYNIGFALRAYADNSPSTQIAAVCAKDNSSAKIRENLLTAIVPKADAYQMLLSDLHKQGNLTQECQRALKDYIAKLVDPKTKSKALQAPGKFTLVFLALIGHIPEANTFIQSRLQKEGEVEWLDGLAQASPQHYAEALKQWLNFTAQEVRSNLNPNNTKLAKPLIAQRFFYELSQNKLTLSSQEWSDTNIILAASQGSDRSILMESMIKAVSINGKSWIQSFKNESPWVQFRLFPILVKAQTPDAIAELERMADKSADNKLRAMANQALQELLTSPKTTH